MEDAKDYALDQLGLRAVAECCCCGELKQVTISVDPYLFELYGDEYMDQYCDDCLEDRRADI